ncbi:MAG: DUF4190 domain-containing protein [Bacteroidales bacterium]|nr:DUF4190 domain-containing protein [Bacteroidales bacterium]
MNIRVIVIFIFITFIISSCGIRGNFGITKRIYKSGYNIDIPWLVKTEPANNTYKNKCKNIQDTSKQKHVNNYENALASIKYSCSKKQNTSEILLPLKINKYYQNAYIKRNSYINKKNNIKPKYLTNASPEKPKRKFEETSIVSFALILLDIAFISLFSFVFSVQPVFLLIGFGFIGMIAIILGSNGLKKIDSNPDNYKGDFFAIIGKYFGLMFLGIALVILLLRFLNSTSVN